MIRETVILDIGKGRSGCMRTPAIPDLPKHLSRVVDSWYNGRAGQSITFDPVSNPYAAALARRRDLAGALPSGVISYPSSVFGRPAEDQLSSRRAA